MHYSVNAACLKLKASTAASLTCGVLGCHLQSASCSTFMAQVESMSEPICPFLGHLCIIAFSPHPSSSSRNWCLHGVPEWIPSFMGDTMEYPWQMGQGAAVSGSQGHTPVPGQPPEWSLMKAPGTRFSRTLKEFILKVDKASVGTVWNSGQY